MLHRSTLATAHAVAVPSGQSPDAVQVARHPDVARTATHRPAGGPARALTYLYLFRRVVVALALVGGGAAWVAEQPWLAAAGLAIAAGEWLESSYYIGVLGWGQRRGMVPIERRADP